MEKNNFVLYKNWKPLIDNLSDEQSGKLFKAIYNYVCGNGTDEVLEDITNSLDITTQMVFRFIQNALHDDLIKYRKKCEKNSEYAKIRWQEKNTNAYESMPTHTNAYNEMRTHKKNADIDIDNDIDNDIDIDNKKKYIKKKCYGVLNNVKLTEEEYQRLCKDYTNAEDIINYFSKYMKEKGYKSKDHNLTIRRWVVEAVNKNVSTPKQDIQIIYDSSKNEPVSDEELETIKRFRSS